MEFRLTILILLPLGLMAAALYAYVLRPFWRRAIDHCETLDRQDAQEAKLREEAERELEVGDNS